MFLLAFTFDCGGVLLLLRTGLGKEDNFDDNPEDDTEVADADCAGDADAARPRLEYFPAKLGFVNKPAISFQKLRRLRLWGGILQKIMGPPKRERGF